MESPRLGDVLLPVGALVSTVAIFSMLLPIGWEQKKLLSAFLILGLGSALRIGEVLREHGGRWIHVGSVPGYLLAHWFCHAVGAI